MKGLILVVLLAVSSLLYADNFKVVKEVKVSHSREVSVFISISLKDCKKKCSKEYLIEILSDEYILISFRREDDIMVLDVKYLGIRV